MKILHCSSLFLATKFKGKSEKIETKLRTINTNTINARKSFFLFKMFKDIKMLQVLQAAKNMPKIENRLAINFYSIHLLYAVLETVHFYCNMKIIPGNLALLGRTYNQLWFVSILAFILKRLYDINELKKQQKQFKEAKNEKSVQEVKLKIKKATMEIFSQFNDIFNCSTKGKIAQFLFNKDFSESVIGLTGALSGITNVTLEHLNNKI